MVKNLDNCIACARDEVDDEVGARLQHLHLANFEIKVLIVAYSRNCASRLTPSVWCGQRYLGIQDNKHKGDDNRTEVKRKTLLRNYRTNGSWSEKRIEESDSQSLVIPRVRGKDTLIYV